MNIYESGYSIECSVIGVRRNIKDYVVAQEEYNEKPVEDVFNQMLEFLSTTKGLKLKEVDALRCSCRDENNNSYKLATTTSIKNGVIKYTPANIVNYILDQPLRNDRIYRDEQGQLVDFTEQGIEAVRQQALYVANRDKFIEMYKYDPQYLMRIITRLLSLGLSTSGHIETVFSEIIPEYKITSLPEYFTTVAEKESSRYNSFVNNYPALRKFMKEQKIKMRLTIG
jgi:hypothetical protein